MPPRLAGWLAGWLRRSTDSARLGVQRSVWPPVGVRARPAVHRTASSSPSGNGAVDDGCPSMSLLASSTAVTSAPPARRDAVRGLAVHSDHIFDRTRPAPPVRQAAAPASGHADNTAPNAPKSTSAQCDGLCPTRCAPPDTQPDLDARHWSGHRPAPQRRSPRARRAAGGKAHVVATGPAVIAATRRASRLCRGPAWTGQGRPLTSEDRDGSPSRR